MRIALQSYMRKRFYGLGLIAFLLILVTGCPSNNKGIKQIIKEVREPKKVLKFSKASIQNFQDYFGTLHKRGLFNGNVLVAEEDSVFTASYGYRQIRKKEALSIEDRFQLASVSKPLTAYATLILVDSGLIDLNANIQSYLPDFPYGEITVHQLLSHRSGLSNYMYVTDSAWANKELALCNDEAYSIFCEQKPMRYYPPDTRFDYCNTNYFLLAYIIEKVAEMPFEAFMAKEVFDPLKMNDTRVYTNMSYANLPHIAVGSNAYGYPKVDFYLNGVSGDKGVYSTVGDMYAFHRELLNPQLVDSVLVANMFKPYSKFSRRGDSYGYGFRLSKRDSSTVIYHKGWWRGYRSYFYHLPEKKATVIALTNTTRGRFLDLKDLIK